MAIKVFGFLCLVACSTASHYAYDYSPVYHQQPLAYVQPPTVYHTGRVATQVAPTVFHAATVATQVAPAATLSAAAVPVVEYTPAPAKYDFSYGVHDSLTGDIKSQRESRDGGIVQGSYSLIDADGYKRTVTYTADDVNGFNAVVHREPLAGIAAPIVAAQVPQQQYLPVAAAPAPFPVPIGSAPAPVPVPVQEPAPVVQPIEDGEYAPEQQQPEPVPQQEDNDFQTSPQSDEDSEVIDSFGAASRSVSTPSESSLNQVPQQQLQK